MSECKPNFFLAGAPKCGTTSLYDYLVTHPQIFLPTVKEPHYFSTDFPTYGYGWVRGTERWGQRLELSDYIGFFEEASPEQTVLGDCSVMYLYSEVAARNIFKFNPDAKFVLMLRNPVDVVHALHATFLKDCVEDEPDFEKAWRLQEARAAGRNLPPKRFCPEPALLQYGAIGRMGEQVERFLNVVPREQVRIYRFEDFIQVPGTVYRDVLSFVELPDDGRSEFPTINSNGVRRFPKLTRFIKRPPFPLNYVKYGVRACLHAAVGSNQAWRISESVSSSKKKRDPLSNDFRAELTGYFKSDQDLLNALLEETATTVSIWAA